MIKIINPAHIVSEDTSHSGLAEKISADRDLTVVMIWGTRNSSEILLEVVGLKPDDMSDNDNIGILSFFRNKLCIDNKIRPYDSKYSLGVYLKGLYSCDLAIELDKLSELPDYLFKAIMFNKESFGFSA